MLTVASSASEGPATGVRRWPIPDAARPRRRTGGAPRPRVRTRALPSPETPAWCETRQRPHASARPGNMTSTATTTRPARGQLTRFTASAPINNTRHIMNDTEVAHNRSCRSRQARPVKRARRRMTTATCPKRFVDSRRSCQVLTRAPGPGLPVAAERERRLKADRAHRSVGAGTGWFASVEARRVVSCNASVVSGPGP